jgi:hypothetical protein
MEVMKVFNIGITPEESFLFNHQGGDTLIFGDVENARFRLVGYNEAYVDGGVVSEKINDLLRIGAGTGGKYDDRSGVHGESKVNSKYSKTKLILLNLGGFAGF